MIGPYSGGQEEAKVGRPFDPFSGDVGGPEGSGDKDVRCWDLLINASAGVGYRHQLVAPSLHHFPQPKGIFRASQELRGVFRRWTTRVKNGNDFHGALLTYMNCRI